jgi:hypothetical protein
LEFYQALRSKEGLDVLIQEFNDEAFPDSKTGELFYLLDDLNIACRLEDFLIFKSRYACQKIMLFIQNEIDKISSRDERAKKLDSYFSEISSLSERLKRDFHLTCYKFFADDLDQVIRNLKEIYEINGRSAEKDVPINLEYGVKKLKWTGGVASLTTLFYELSKQCFNDKESPYISATAKQLEIFIVENFTDENGETFSKASVDTYLDPSKPEKKAKRDRVPVESMNLENKQ